MKDTLQFEKKITDKMTDTVMRFFSRNGSERNLRRARHRAVRRAYVQFARRYPRWAQSLFDDYFVNHTARDILSNDVLRPRALAEAWTAQLHYRDEAQRRRHVLQIMPVAHTFVRLVRAEMV